MTATGPNALLQRGRAWVFGDNIPNDAGIMTIEMTRRAVYDPATLAQACMCDIDPEFPRKAQPGDFIVAGRNFGRGQLHVQGPLGIKGLGLAVVSESMSRSFFRLSMSVGVAMLPFCPDVRAGVGTGDTLEVDFGRGLVRNLTRRTELQFEPLPGFLLDILAAGGERAWLKQQAGAA